jgi:hypothetical protein
MPVSVWCKGSHHASLGAVLVALCLPSSTCTSTTCARERHGVISYSFGAILPMIGTDMVGFKQYLMKSAFTCFEHRRLYGLKSHSSEVLSCTRWMTKANAVLMLLVVAGFCDYLKLAEACELLKGCTVDTLGADRMIMQCYSQVTRQMSRVSQSTGELLMVSQR